MSDLFNIKNRFWKFFSKKNKSESPFSVIKEKVFF